MPVEGMVIDLHPLIQHEVFRIGQEAVRNASMHSGENRIEVELSYFRDLMLRVSGNGKGIIPELGAEDRRNHFALTGMKERVEQVGGKLSLFSSAESGTEMEPIVPGGIAYLVRCNGLIAVLRRLRAAERRSSRLG